MPQPYLTTGRIVRMVLVLLFIVLPVLEIVTIVVVSRQLGGWATFGLIVAGMVLGAWVVRLQGRRSWQQLRQTVEDIPLRPDAIGGPQRREPQPLADGALVLAGGVLLMVPGFLTDLLALLFLLPVTRPLARATLAYLVGRRVSGTVHRIRVQTWEAESVVRDGAQGGGTWTPNGPGAAKGPGRANGPGTANGPGGPSGLSGAGGATVRGEVVD